jgi:hypothetical protein
MFEQKVVWKKPLKDGVLRIDDGVVWLADEGDYTRRVRIIGLKNTDAVYVLARCNEVKVLVCAVREEGTIFSSYCSTLVMYSDGSLEIEVG